MKHLGNTRATASLLPTLMLAALAGCASAGGTCTDPSCAHDAELRERVEAAVFADAALRAPNRVDVRVRNGVVYLSGMVSTDLQRSDAESHARSAQGVNRLVNNIAVQNIGR